MDDFFSQLPKHTHKHNQINKDILVSGCSMFDVQCRFITCEINVFPNQKSKNSISNTHHTLDNNIEKKIYLHYYRPFWEREIKVFSFFLSKTN